MQITMHLVGNLVAVGVKISAFRLFSHFFHLWLPLRLDPKPGRHLVVNAPGGISHRRAGQVGISCRRFRILMPQNRAYDGQAITSNKADAGKGVA